MKKVLGISLALVVALTAVASGKPSDGSSVPNIELWNADVNSATLGSATTGLSATIFVDTVQYGGTWWASDSARWEALPDSEWTFDTGIASSTTGSGKPGGYHYLMEGWYGHDNTAGGLTYFRRTLASGVPGPNEVVEPCAVIGGNASFWGGVTLTEANGLCYAGGRGYGENWTITVSKSVPYDGSGTASFSFLHNTESEGSFDFFDVYIDTSGDKSADDILLFSYSGVTGGPVARNINLDEADGTLPVGAGNVLIKFNINSDGAYSDQDGNNPTACGHTSVDNIQMSASLGGSFSDFEAGADGWALQTPTPVGDYSDIKHHVSQLGGTYQVFCPCDMQDTVLVFIDPTGFHPLDQDNVAYSPWINLARNGGVDAGKPGTLVIYSGFFDMSQFNYVFVQFQIRYYPALCAATGLVYLTGFRDQGIVFYYGEQPTCNPVGSRYLRNYTNVVQASAEQMQLAFGMINLCRTEPFGFACTGTNNKTPWIDNVSVGKFGEKVAPQVTIVSFDNFQDNFASDGTLNPASTAHVDTNRLKGSSAPDPESILADTLVAGGDGGNTEVYIVFRVTPGPFCNATALSNWATSHWEGPDGAGWYYARMDTTEQGGVKTSGRWMTALHELTATGAVNPKFTALTGGNDATPDPGNGNQIASDIFPDNILTPGSRIDYFVKSRYSVTDTRNTGGTSWFYLPDTTTGNTLEIEILPSSVDSDTTWNCVLYVDGHDDRFLGEQRLLEDALQAASTLSGGGNTPEGTAYDRWDVETPSSGQLFLGRPLFTEYGCSPIQIFAYKVVAWAASNLGGSQLTDETANILKPWLQLQEVGGNRFWLSGDDVANAVAASDQFSAVDFMQNVCGVIRTCNTVRIADCPSGSALDSTFCLVLNPVGGADFTTMNTTNARGNGCPNLNSYDLLAPNGAVATAKGQLTYNKAGLGATDVASVTNYVSVALPPFDYKTVWDGWRIGFTRTESVDTHNPALCNDLTGLNARVDEILDWFALGETHGAPCNIPAAIVDAGKLPVGNTPPAFRHSLGNAYPNPMNPTTVIKFTNGVDKGRVTLQIFDVTGRLVRTLVDANMDAGVHEVLWDGTGSDGSSAPSGLYFYNMTTADGFKTSKKLVMMK